MRKWILLLKTLPAVAVFVVILMIAQKLVTTYRASSSTMPDLFTEEITDRFYAYATKITGKQSLYVAKLQQTEVFERTSRAKALWFDLPSVVVKAEVPVEYNYFVNLTAGWRFEKNQTILVVYVPDLTSSKPAVDIAGMKLGIEKGSILRNEQESLQRLSQELSGLLVDRSIEHRALVREQARKSVEDFVRAWLGTAFQLKDDQSIEVRFSGETSAGVLNAN
ncbi:hypothetical protein EZJ49_10065 [Bdellovibrio bacteriovorus]|uniref:hypothetical protein n=1 Tax=Bdellovibrio bacteriovorus TaxID=959 RepID=UPI0021CE9970|nr:hypothetical protein [Bdellovibrio bacteriovorus]UXR63420.1 hypothetical protein EZJ49_10065 [Bdellovibrio bacteriovorus]